MNLIKDLQAHWYDSNVQTVCQLLFIFIMTWPVGDNFIHIYHYSMDLEPKAIPEEKCVLVREGEKAQSQFDSIASSIYSGHHFT
jgi:hypothetical protein